MWDAISDTPGQADNRQLRRELMTAIRGQIDRFGWSQTIAAQNLGVTQPRLSDLYRGNLSKFSLDALVNLGAKVGVHVGVHVDTDTLFLPMEPRSAHAKRPWDAGGHG